MKKLALACERIAATTKKLEKIAIVADYMKSCALQEASASAVFLSGRPFPTWEEATLQVGGSLLWRLVAEISGKPEAEITSSYRKLGDLGAVAADILPARDHSELSIVQVEDRFRQIASVRGPAAKTALVRELLTQVSPLEAKYIVKIMTGDLRIGLKESLVEEAIAKAYGDGLVQVQRANMLLGDIGETTKFAIEGRLDEAKMRLFHPLGFMLASPAQNAEEALSYFENALIEDKYDGIRAQVHVSASEVRIFSRTRDEITASFPELPDAFSALDDVILDGEIVAWSYLTDDPGEAGRALPFSALQQRLGRKKVTEEMMGRVPVAYLAFDVLYANGELLIDRPLRERAEILDSLITRAKGSNHKRHKGKQTEAQHRLDFGEEMRTTAQIIRSAVRQANAPDELNDLFEAAQARGNEGLMIKDPDSAYAPGRRGKWWLKMKRELATLDVVVTAVEYGHGKRIGVLSDYTFAVWDRDRLVNIGKAYSGLTDVEINEMTTWFLEHVVEDQGFRLIVEPKIVLEVAFNNMMRSDRHDSGYALRFPRIVRLRPDKPPQEADTIERAKEIYEKQGRS
ncbi:MAG TPA: ATP-dependent DNA ligase [Terriglobales bacterium]|jgi:DNA ligase-1